MNIVNSKIKLGIVTTTLLVVSTACSTTATTGSDPAFASVRPVDAQPLPIDSGSIYKSGYGIKLFEDNKASKIGDILTVVLDERKGLASGSSITSLTAVSKA